LNGDGTTNTDSGTPASYHRHEDQHVARLINAGSTYGGWQRGTPGSKAGNSGVQPVRRCQQPTRTRIHEYMDRYTRRIQMTKVYHAACISASSNAGWSTFRVNLEAAAVGGISKKKLTKLALSGEKHRPNRCWRCGHVSIRPKSSRLSVHLVTHLRYAPHPQIG